MDSSKLISVLSESQQLGFLGPGPIEAHLRHSAGFLDIIEESKPTPKDILDLGTGGGIPGLFLALALPDARISLLDASVKRCAFLKKTVTTLELDHRVEVICERAEVAGRSSLLRGAFSTVVARSFAQPPITAECGAPFLQKDGVLIVSEPPESDIAIRWPKTGCAKVSLVPEQSIKSTHTFVKLRMINLCPDEYPRRVGIPTKRPIF
jgi:16S rRNA (guanine527-N7)-methyltransferase